jgi:hypothetical protein
MLGWRMARKVKRLSDRTVRAIGKPGRHADGDGLYLIVEPSGAKRWLFMFRWQGRLKEMGLGGLSGVSLADARAAADQARRTLATGKNPIEVRREERAAEAGVVTFGQVADEIVASLSEGFRNEKHKAQWTSTLTTYASTIRDKAVAHIDTADDAPSLGAPEQAWLCNPWASAFHACKMM